jgi:hypothetical protein
MNVKNIDSIIQKVGNAVGNAAVNVAAFGVENGTAAARVIDNYADNASKQIGETVSNQAYNALMKSTGGKTAVQFYEGIMANSGRIGNSLGAGLEGLAVGSATGAVLGGIGGGISDNDTILGGAAKGALGGGMLGMTYGSISGAYYNNSRLFDNTSNGISKIAKKVSTWKAGQGSGV